MKLVTLINYLLTKYKYMEIKKDMVFEYVENIYMKYFIPQKLMMIDSWYGLSLDKYFNIIGFNYYIPQILKNKERFKLAEKTLDTLWAGDILQDEAGSYIRVRQRTGSVVFINSRTDSIEKVKSDNELNTFCSIQELKNNGYQLVEEEEEEEYPTHLEYTSDIFANMNIVIDKFIKDTEDFKNKLNKRL